MAERVARLEELGEGEVKAVSVGGVQIALIRAGDKVFALDDVCTHEACIISENYALHGAEVECTCHGSHFNIKTGANTVPPAAAPLTTYDVKIENGEVFIEI
ncbi:MAG TPA: non-heme iron oxygenase ferredoxin subunit [Candidatus Nanoarchaeia archaeon]